MPTHRQIIRRKTLLWQITAVGIVAGAGAIAGLPSIGNLFVPGKPVVAKGPTGGLPPVEPAKRGLDFDAVKRTFVVVSPPVAAPPAPVTVAEAHPEDAPPPLPPPTDWTYVGSIITPKSRHALVRIDGQQQIFAIGAVRDQNKLVAIEADHIDIDVNGEVKRVDLTQRTMLSPAEPPKRPVAFRSPPVIGQPGQAGGPMAMGMTPPMMQPNMGQQAPATFEQARAASAAIAAKQRAVQQPPPIPAPTPTPTPILTPSPALPAEKNSDDKNAALKMLTDPGMDDAERTKFANTLGLHPGMSDQDRVNRLTASGLDAATAKAISTIIEQNEKKESDK